MSEKKRPYKAGSVSYVVSSAAPVALLGIVALGVGFRGGTLFGPNKGEDPPKKVFAAK